MAVDRNMVSKSSIKNKLKSSKGNTEHPGLREIPINTKPSSSLKAGMLRRKNKFGSVKNSENGKPHAHLSRSLKRKVEEECLSSPASSKTKSDSGETILHDKSTACSNLTEKTVEIGVSGLKQELDNLPSQNLKDSHVSQEPLNFSTSMLVHESQLPSCEPYTAPALQAPPIMYTSRGSYTTDSLLVPSLESPMMILSSAYPPPRMSPPLASWTPSPQYSRSIYMRASPSTQHMNDLIAKYSHAPGEQEMWSPRVTGKTVIAPWTNHEAVSTEHLLEGSGEHEPHEREPQTLVEGNGLVEVDAWKSIKKDEVLSVGKPENAREVAASSVVGGTLESLLDISDLDMEGDIADWLLDTPLGEDWSIEEWQASDGIESGELSESFLVRVESNESSTAANQSESFVHSDANDACFVSEADGNFVHTTHTEQRLGEGQCVGEEFVDLGETQQEADFWKNLMGQYTSNDTSGDLNVGAATCEDLSCPLLF